MTSCRAILAERLQTPNCLSSPVHAPCRHATKSILYCLVNSIQFIPVPFLCKAQIITAQPIPLLIECPSTPSLDDDLLVDSLPYIPIFHSLVGPYPRLV